MSPSPAHPEDASARPGQHRGRPEERPRWCTAKASDSPRPLYPRPRTAPPAAVWRGRAASARPCAPPPAARPIRRAGAGTGVTTAGNAAWAAKKHRRKSRQPGNNAAPEKPNAGICQTERRGLPRRPPVEMARGPPGGAAGANVGAAAIAELVRRAELVDEAEKNRGAAAKRGPDPGPRFVDLGVRKQRVATFLRAEALVRLAELVDEAQARGEINAPHRPSKVSESRTVPIPRQRVAEGRSLARTGAARRTRRRGAGTRGNPLGAGTQIVRDSDDLGRNGCLSSACGDVPAGGGAGATRRTRRRGARTPRNAPCWRQPAFGGSPGFGLPPGQAARGGGPFSRSHRRRRSRAQTGGLCVGPRPPRERRGMRARVVQPDGDRQGPAADEPRWRPRG